MSLDDADEQTQQIRESLAAMHNAVAFLQEHLEELPIAQQVDIGQLLWWLHERGSDAMELVKARMRQHAADIGEGAPGLYPFRGVDPAAVCTVSVPVVTARLREGVDLQRLKRALGPKFDLLFEADTVHKPRKDFQSKLDGLTPEEVRALGPDLEMDEGTPRVTFRSFHQKR